MEVAKSVVTSRRLLVPLDGSAESNAVLPLVRTLAKALSTSMTLLRVVSGDNREATLYAESNLKRIAEELSGSGLEADGVVRHGHVVEQILQEIALDPPVMVAMRTHGRGGIERAILGSVTQHLLQRTLVPMVLMRPGERRVTRIQKLLVPVDGSPGGAVALGTALKLAQATGAAVKLVQIVVPLSLVTSTSNDFGGMGYYDPSWDEDILASARDYVGNLTKRLKDDGYVVEGEALMGPYVPMAIVDVADREAVDLIVMSTHALTGPARAVLGSVADAVVRSAHCPVLLVHRTESATDGENETAVQYATT
jgi:nucleotide-binding universal stress UspA family protein